MQQLIISVVIMYLMVAAAALWYRRSQARTTIQLETQSAENERRS